MLKLLFQKLSKENLIIKFSHKCLNGFFLIETFPKAFSVVKIAKSFFISKRAKREVSLNFTYRTT